MCTFTQTSIPLPKLLCNSKGEVTFVLIVDKGKKNIFKINKISTYLCTYLVRPHLEVDSLFLHNYKVNQYIITWSCCILEYWCCRFLLSQANLIVNLQKKNEIGRIIFEPNSPECFDLCSDTICNAPKITQSRLWESGINFWFTISKQANDVRHLRAYKHIVISDAIIFTLFR